MSQIENPPQEKMKEILTNAKTIAVVGLSPKEDRASNEVARYLQSKGYKIIPVNPMYPEILGEKSYSDLSQIPDKVDIIDVFRRPEQVGPVIDEAVKIDAPVVWLQLGIRNDPEAQKVIDTGKIIIQDRCILIEHKSLVD